MVTAVSLQYITFSPLVAFPQAFVQDSWSHTSTQLCLGCGAEGGVGSEDLGGSHCTGPGREGQDVMGGHGGRMGGEENDLALHGSEFQ